nr:PAS domain-containing protein [Anaerolineae bacterium]
MNETPSIDLTRLINIVFHDMPAGVALFDRDMRVIHANRTWQGFIDRYTPSRAEDVVPGISFFDLAPGTRDRFQPLFERVMGGETIRMDAFESESGGIVSYWDVIFSPLVADGEIVGILDVTTDATERVLARRRLEQNQANLRSLLENARGFAVYQLIVEPDEPFDARVSLASPSLSNLLGIEDPYNFSAWFRDVHPEDLPVVTEAHRQSVEQQAPYDQSARFYQRGLGEWRWVRIISNPAVDDSGQTIIFNGLIIDITDQKRAEKELRELNLTLEQRIAERTAEIEQRREVAESLRGVLQIINSERALLEILDYIVRVAHTLMRADASGVVRFDMERQYAITEASYGFPVDLPTSGYPLNRPGSETTDRAIENREPRVVRQFNKKELRAYLHEAEIEPSLKAWRLRALEVYDAFLALPLVVKGQVYGSLMFYYKAPQEFPEEQVETAMSFAEQTALAIETARLHQQIQVAAAAQERNRLARELHDAVSQTLFSASLIAEVLPALWDKNQEAGRQRLEELRQLTRGAQAEMRTLLLELRPQVILE